VKTKTTIFMKTSFKIKAAVLFAVAVMFSCMAYAQDAKKPVASPRDSVSGTVHGASININYGSPSVRGRKIWGALVPYGQVWRVGANEATRFTTSKDIKVEGKKLPAGTYGLFAIPTDGKWTIIFNSVPNQWGAFKYDSSKDVLRVDVTPVKADMHERLVYTIDGNGFSLIWEQLAIPVRIK
jgi:hypothetical protein